MDSDRLIVVGAGYVGLVAGTCFASAGYKVGVVENNAQKLLSLKEGICPFYEPSLSELMKEGINAGKLKFYADQKSAIQELNPNFIFCAVGTPESPDGSANLKYVEEALKESLSIETKEDLYFVLKSTVPVGTGKKLQEIAQEKTNGKLWVVNNPEFLREGTAVSDFIRPERVVLGGAPEAVNAVAKLYESFLLNNRPLIKTDSTSAELGKLAANLMLASRISLVNQVARLSSATGGNIRAIERILQTDSRIGSKYLYAGLGFGGSCFPKDIKNFIHLCGVHGVESSIAQSIDTFNDEQKLFFMKDIQKEFPNPKETTISLLGLAFKPDTDDIRESPALSIAEYLYNAGYKVKVYDPKAMGNFKAWAKHLKDLSYCSNASDCLKDAKAVILVTEWQEFQRLSADKFKSLFKGSHIYDGKNVLAGEELKKAGFTYKGIGQS
ncbi:MAG: UDP-glucose/GDP-mannose dehydrogenase family protein [Bdellovibrionota bacterium]